MKFNSKTFATLESLAQNSSHNPEIKSTFKRNALSALWTIAKELNLNKDSYEVRYNEGGIAVSGEATLHHENFYIQLSEFPYWRTCEGRKDYVGGYNRPLRNVSPERLIEEISKILKVSA